MLKESSRDDSLAWEVFWQSLDMTRGKVINEARKECENPLTTTSASTVLLCLLVQRVLMYLLMQHERR